MLILTGLLRQQQNATIKGEEKLKIVVEHTTARNDGTEDLHLETMFLPLSEAQKCPKTGEQVSVEVNAWVSGRNVAYSATGLHRAKATA